VLAFGWRGMLKVKHAIAGSTAEYLPYILPGLLVMSVLFTTVYSGVALNTDLTKGSWTGFDRCRSGARRRWWDRCSVTVGLVVVFSFGLSRVFTTLGLLPPHRAGAAVLTLVFASLTTRLHHKG
jgi:hypothetical protein